jgi:hypothetical protein
MCKHIQLKDNTWYYRRRIPEDVRSLHRHTVTKKPTTSLFFSLKTSDKKIAAREADSQTRRLDALWKSHREGESFDANAQVSIAKLESAGLEPNDGTRLPNHNRILDFVDDLVGRYEPEEPVPSISRQDRLTLDILYGAQVPRTLNVAKDKHFSLGKGPRGSVAEKQFYRAWNLLLEITGDISLANIRREHGKEFVRRLVDTGVGAETVN